jgi:uncharacterized protein YacL
MRRVWSVNLIRAVFFALAVFVGIAISLGFRGPAWIGALSGASFMGMLLLLEVIFAKVTLSDFSHATFGLSIGLFCAWLVTRIGIFDLPWFQMMEDGDALRNVVEICIFGTLAFFGMTLALRSDRDQFAFLIPYVRFRQAGSEGEPMILDTSVIVDGRVPGLIATGFLSGTLVIPRFVLNELQALADSRDSVKSAAGKRGLAQVESIRAETDLRVTILDDQAADNQEPVDSRLVTSARELNARLLTNDENLSKVARLRGITVLNLRELVKILSSDVRIGDRVELELTKPGKESHQAVGYLPGGAMIVVNHAADRIPSTVTVRVASEVATSGGRLIFAELDVEPK